MKPQNQSLKCRIAVYCYYVQSFQKEKANIKKVPIEV